MCIRDSVRFDVQPRQEASLLMTILVSWGPTVSYTHLTLPTKRIENDNDVPLMPLTEMIHWGLEGRRMQGRGGFVLTEASIACAMDNEEGQK